MSGDKSSGTHHGITYLITSTLEQEYDEWGVKWKFLFIEIRKLPTCLHKDYMEPTYYLHDKRGTPNLQTSRLMFAIY